jgi:hypothetical protein
MKLTLLHSGGVFLNFMVALHLQSQRHCKWSKEAKCQAGVSPICHFAVLACFVPLRDKILLQEGKLPF